MSRSHRRTTATRLITSLRDLIGPGLDVVKAHEREWASATFCGARHGFDVRIALPRDEAAPAGLARLPDHEFDLPDAIVADCCAADMARSYDAHGQAWLTGRIEILTIEDR